MTIAKYKKKVFTTVSEYIRRRDSDKQGMCRCCTCGIKKHWKQMHAGHFRHGSTKLSYFFEKNIHAQCAGCNMYKSGDLASYAVFLEKKYGYGILQEIKKMSDSTKTWKRSDLDKILEYYKEKLKCLKD